MHRSSTAKKGSPNSMTKKQSFLLKQDLKIEGDMWTEFFLVRHSKFAPSCHLLKKVESHHKSTAKKGSPNSVTDF